VKRKIKKKVRKKEQVDVGLEKLYLDAKDKDTEKPLSKYFGSTFTKKKVAERWSKN
jgi:hypothetical protein